MRHILRLISAAALGLALEGCAHTPRATVAMKVNETEAHVGLGSREVSIGDRIAFFENICQGATARQEGAQVGPACHKAKVGGGRVVQVLNQDYSVVTADTGVHFKEGEVVERD